MQSAVVIGGGMAGLATAEVLSMHFGRVVVVDKDSQQQDLLGVSSVDAWRKGSKARPGVLQYNQIHVLQAQGLRTLDTIFGGRYSAALQASGGHIIDMLQHILAHHPVSGPGPWLRHTPSQAAAAEPIYTALGTRHLFETTARKLLTDNPRVEFLYGTSVAGLLFEDADSSAPGAAAAAASDLPSQHKVVTGVRLCDGSTIPAQLVVGCSGRASSMPAWLAAAGLQRPRTSRAGCDSGYSGWLCTLSPEVQKVLEDNEVHFIATMAAAPVRTLFNIVRVEDGLYLASLGGSEGLYPSAGEESVMKFAREELWHPCALNILAGCEFKTPVTCAHKLNSTWRHYEELALPDGLLVLGDAVCSLNPTYGQGMTVAAVEVAKLGALLSARAAAGAAKSGPAAATGSKSAAVDAASPASAVSTTRDTSASTRSSGTSTGWLAGLHKEFQQAIYPTIKDAWDMAVGADMAFESASSDEPYAPNVVERLAAAYVKELFKLAGTDYQITVTLMKLFGMLEPPQSVMRPSTLLRFLAYKALEHAPAPIRGLLAAALRPWGIADRAPSPAAAAALGAAPGPKEAALARLMGWPTANSG